MIRLALRNSESQLASIVGMRVLSAVCLKDAAIGESIHKVVNAFSSLYADSSVHLAMPTLEVDLASREASVSSE
jgi:hypothetical protein